MKLHIYAAAYGDQSQKFLDLMATSLDAQTFQDFAVTLVSSGEFVPKFPPKHAHYHSDERLHYPSAIAKGYEISPKDSELILLLNDDVILHKDCLKTLVEMVSVTEVIANPMSTCCNGRFYQAPLGAGEYRFLKNQYSYDEIMPIVDDIIHRAAIHSPMFFYTGMVAFFCTMMRRTTWEKIGGIDTNFRTGFDDSDFSNRARQVGIPCGIVTNSFCLHFSGKSADLHLSLEDRKFNEKYYVEKHGRA